ncbi:MAG TPA: aldehyde dehydrogenase family protein [Candidatus Nanopelagicaceae bacterium]|nr:aldehyde dehydrogenase family protein [Candidatus Nanopelagicaceae bacterium]
MSRLSVRKTYKLFIGGAFPRSESGRSYKVMDKSGNFIANPAMASRKDARDAVVAARSALSGWSGTTAYNRGQILYRVAELMESRRDEFIEEVSLCEGIGKGKSAKVLDAAIDRWVWYAGWSDKLGSILGATNPVAGPFYNFSIPEPVGVVALIAPQDSSLLGLIDLLGAALTSGNTVVALASEKAPLPAITLSEVLATSDVPAGVVNILTGNTKEVAPWLASHMDVDAINLAGVEMDDVRQLASEATDNLKRVIPPKSQDWSRTPTLTAMTSTLEVKTVWHPIGV